MDELDSGGWLLNPDFDEGSVMADFDCEDFMAMTNPTCSPEHTPNSPHNIMSGAWKETFAKLKALQQDQRRETVTLGSGFIINDTDEFHFEHSPHNMEDDDSEETDAVQKETGSACVLCDKTFKYRHEVVSHLECVHNRCTKCEYKFETAEDLNMHIRLNSCGTPSAYHEDNIVDDDNLSISGDEDTSTPEWCNDRPATVHSPEQENQTKPAAGFDDQIDNKDAIRAEIKQLEQLQIQKSLRYQCQSHKGPKQSLELHRPRQMSEQMMQQVNELLLNTIQVKQEPMSDEESFEFESSRKNVAKIKPNSLLKKRLRPAMSLSAKLSRNKLKQASQATSTARPPATPTTPATLTVSPATPVPPVSPPVSPPKEAPASPPKVMEEEVPLPVVIKAEPVDQEDLEEEITCLICDLTVEGCTEFQRHSLTHNIDNTYTGVNCVVCDTLLPNMPALDAHEREKHSLFAYKCGDCYRIFNTQSMFKEHEKIHNNFVKCAACKKNFIDQERLEHHQNFHCRLSGFKCTRCDLTFTSVPTLEEHLKQQHNKWIYRCDKCGKEFNQKQSLSVHRMSHTGEEKPFKCKVCGKGFKTYWYYVVHEKCYCKHIDKNVRMLPPSMESSKKKFYQCKICCRVFPHISHLKVHNYIHTGERPYKCGSCGKGFTQKQNLKVHERVHTGEKPYICNSCGFGFKDLGNLRRHQYIHTGEKPHGCDKCSKRFTWIESLRRHKRTHLKQRPYECKICKREFVHHGHLRIHELVHKDEKPFQCNICGKAFTMLSSLSIHEHIHLDRKPYPCDMCQRTFMTASALTTHKQSHVQRMANAYRQAYRDRFSF